MGPTDSAFFLLGGGGGGGGGGGRGGGGGGGICFRLHRQIQPCREPGKGPVGGSGRGCAIGRESYFQRVYCPGPLFPKTLLPRTHIFKKSIVQTPYCPEPLFSEPPFSKSLLSRTAIVP